jgi:hypothetical protein
MSAIGILKNGVLHKCIHVKQDGSEIEFQLHTDPPEALFWSTYRLKKSDISIVTKGLDRSAKAELRQEILDEIQAVEDAHKIYQERNSANNKHAKTRSQQQKTRRRNQES